MNITALEPEPIKREAFRRSREGFIPVKAGCYVLTNYSQVVMYVGLAKNLRTRFTQHLDSEEKTAITKVGKAVLFFWFQTEEINKIERTWMNTHIQYEGTLPLLNKVYSPIKV